ncbi:Cof-type HAD-IIB family hydrolase [Ligilactobacillus pobuzihii]|uniref:Cof-type HAD-IIB family hydrolase n=1 Tax=Ligilactobacillus pobuzihii TaxID=449659 RepID=UPI0019D2271C|nr:Cof-type HAD-IIB family hydrolase [Ligilactobacillus pobuzihii]MBN7275229.1 Cof-type HAD-IIB family hydrolase [Ligilactobacillus pobuzihii]
MQQKLISLDLDGTTLNSSSQISPKTKNVLQAVSQAGHIVTIVTGRSDKMALNFYDELGLKTPMVNFNGAVGHFPHGQSSDSYEITFHKEIVLDILASKSTLGIQAIAAEGKGLTLTDSTDSSLSPFFPAASRSQDVLNKMNLTKDPSAITMLVDPFKKAEITQQLQQTYDSDVTVSVWGGPAPVLELSPKNINKKVGLKFLSQHFNIPQQNIIAFGDEQNDVEMLKYAGTGVAMKNASSWIQDVANVVTTVDNDHDGLAQYLEQNLLQAE